MARLRMALAALAVALSACGSSSARSDSAARRAHCGPAAAKTLAASGQGRVYVTHRTVYACSVRTGRRTRLGQSTRTGPGQALITRVRVTGGYAAYERSQMGVDTSSSQVTEIRLSDGKRMFTAPAATAVLGPESFRRVTGLVVARSGGVAWIGRSESIGTQRAQYQVFAAERGTVRQLDSGSAIAPGSLRLRSGQLSWTDGGQTRTATLR